MLFNVDENIEDISKRGAGGEQYGQTNNFFRPMSQEVREAKRAPLSVRFFGR